MDFDKRYNRAISQSLVESYLKCGLAAKFQYVDGLRRVNTRMATGTALSRCACEDNREKMYSGKPLALMDLQNIAVEEYEAEIEANDVVESKIDIAKGKDRTASAAVAFGERVSPKLNGVIAAEETITVKVDDDVTYAGTPDYVTEDGIGDLKTGKPWNQTRANNSRQLTAYSILHKSRYGEFPKRVWIDTLYAKGKGWEAARLWSRRQEEDYRGFIYIVKAVVSGFNAGVFLPAAETEWYCSEKWCSYWKICPAKGRRG